LAFLDKGVLLRCFREYRMARASNVPAGGRMTTTLAVLNWLSHYQDWLRVLSPASQTLQWPSDDSHCSGPYLSRD
jgi:hypothetical protein